MIALWEAARRDLEAAGAEVVEVDFPVVSNYESDRPGAPSFLTRGLVSREFLTREILDLSAWAWDGFLRANGDPALLAPWRSPEDDDATVRELLALQGRSGRLWSVAAVKLFIDGTIDGGTAWLHEADCHGQSTQAYWQDPHDYTEAVRVRAQAGVQTATHAIGDAAVQHVLDTLAKVVPAGSAVRHRIERIETLPSDQVPRFAELGVVASMQPSHATYYTRADHSDNWSRRLGDERADRAWRCRDLLEAGAVLTLGSDWPIAPFDPRGVMAAARLRRPAERPDLGPVGPAQALTARQALYGYTVAPALAASAGHLGGRIAAGYRADLTAFAASPLSTPAADLPGVPVTLTMVDGTIRHRATHSVTNRHAGPWPSWPGRGQAQSSGRCVEHASIRRTYGRILRWVVTEFGAGADPGEVSAERLAAWFTAQWAERAPSTWDVALDAIRSAATYWWRQGWIGADPARLLQRAPTGLADLGDHKS